MRRIVDPLDRLFRTRKKESKKKVTRPEINGMQWKRDDQLFCIKEDKIEGKERKRRREGDNAHPIVSIKVKRAVFQASSLSIL